MNDSCDLCEVILDDIKLKIDRKKCDKECEKVTLMDIHSALQNLCPDFPEFRYEHLKSKILKKSRDLSKRSNDCVYKWMKTDYRVDRNEIRRGQNEFTRKIPLSFRDFSDSSQSVEILQTKKKYVNSFSPQKEYRNKSTSHSYEIWNRPQGNNSKIIPVNPVCSDTEKNSSSEQCSRSQPETVANNSRIEHHFSMFYPKFGNKNSNENLSDKEP